MRGLGHPLARHIPFAVARYVGTPVIRYSGKTVVRQVSELRATPSATPTRAGRMDCAPSLRERPDLRAALAPVGRGGGEIGTPTQRYRGSYRDTAIRSATYQSVKHLAGPLYR
jgi:hypothetical protein